ncbi:MAG: winged helix-turn-helix transcriptional regulator [bacterium]
MKKLEALQKILQLSEYVKLEIIKDKEKNHHPLKNNLSKSNNRIILLLERKGALNQRTISKCLSISPQAVSEAIKKLESENYIVKDNINKNETLILLTKEGLEHAILSKDIISNHANELLKDFNDEELQNVIDFSIKLLPKEENNV